VGDEEYRAFGAGKVPDAVATLINLSPASFQAQLDAHFWFSSTGGTISKELNAIVNLTAIDDSLSFLAQELRKTKAELDVSKGRVKSARVRINDHLWVEGADRVLRKLERGAAAIAHCDARLHALRDAIDRAGKVAGRLHIAADAKLGALDAMRAGGRAFALAGRTNALRAMLGRLERALELSSIELSPLPDIEPIRDLKLKTSILRNTIVVINREEKELWRKRTELAELKKQLDAVPKCPKCGQVIVK
jgi:hypothetical protein